MSLEGEVAMLRFDTGYRFRNWDETLECRPERFYRPESEEEVLEIVREASDAGGTVRTFGAGHSWSPLVLTDGLLRRRLHLRGGVRAALVRPFRA